MNPAENLRPTAGKAEGERIALYVGGSYRTLERDAALRLYVELGEALELVTPERIRFHEWAAGRHYLPEAEQVMEQFSVSRATAHRWLAKEREARELFGRAA